MLLHLPLFIIWPGEKGIPLMSFQKDSGEHLKKSLLLIKTSCKFKHTSSLSYEARSLHKPDSELSRPVTRCKPRWWHCSLSLASRLQSYRQHWVLRIGWALLEVIHEILPGCEILHKAFRLCSSNLDQAPAIIHLPFWRPQGEMKLQSRKKEGQ